MSSSWDIGDAGYTRHGKAASGERTAPVGAGLGRRTVHSGLTVYWNGPLPSGRSGAYGAPGGLLAKRLMDVVGASIALVLLAPLLLLAGVAIKASSAGPVFFLQRREGLHGAVFNIIKFRTMRSDGGASGACQAGQSEGRVTRLGAFLRRTSIDELPQLFNVLRGDMSLVGPRPHVPGMLVLGRPYGDVVPFYTLRHRMLPGITGWAQANGLRGQSANEAVATERIAHDVAYIANYSLKLDCVILLQTIRREFLTGTGT